MADYSKIKVNNLFGEKEEKSVEKPKVVESTCEVKFCTGGRLSAPAVLHFRDYNMSASQALAELPKAKDHMPLIIDILNTMIVEDFNCENLHLEEVKEILLNVYAKWWGAELQGFNYILDLDKKGEELVSKENISITNIPISSIQVNPLNEKVKEPINVTINGKTVKFLYPRVKNSIISKQLTTEEYALQEQQFHKLSRFLQLPVEKRLESDYQPSDEELKAYDSYKADRTHYELTLDNAQVLYGIDDIVFDSFEKRVDAIQGQEVTIKHWAAYNSFLSGVGDFGINDEVEFYSDVLEKKVKRSFPFRTYNLLPVVSMAADGVEQSEISFG